MSTSAKLTIDGLATLQYLADRGGFATNTDLDGFARAIGLAGAHQLPTIALDDAGLVTHESYRFGASVGGAVRLAKRGARRAERNSL